VQCCKTVRYWARYYYTRATILSYSKSSEYYAEMINIELVLFVLLRYLCNSGSAGNIYWVYRVCAYILLAYWTCCSFLHMLTFTLPIAYLPELWFLPANMHLLVVVWFLRVCSYLGYDFYRFLPCWGMTYCYYLPVTTYSFWGFIDLLSQIFNFVQTKQCIGLRMQLIVNRY